MKWQQISEDLVPVNITCLQDGPEYIFHITAYNSQVEKIMDIRLVQPGINTYWIYFRDKLITKSTILIIVSGTKIGLASECFAYWKEPHSNDTWGLNFTSPIDAKQFKECCVRTILNLRMIKSNRIYGNYFVIDSNCEIVSEIVFILFFKIRYVKKARYKS